MYNTLSKPIVSAKNTAILTEAIQNRANTVCARMFVYVPIMQYKTTKFRVRDNTESDLMMTLQTFVEG